MSDIRRVVLTHQHVDHTGLAADVHRASTATIAAHPHVVDALVEMPRHAARRVSLLERAGQGAGAPASLVQQALAVAADRWALAASVPRDAMMPLGDGDRLAVAGIELRVLYTPGHTRDHLCLVHEPSGAAFTGDLLLRHLHTIPHLEERRAEARSNPLADLIDSWRRVGQRPLAIAWPGHGRAIRAHRMLVAHRLVWARRRLADARETLRAGPRTAWELATALGLADRPEDLEATLGETAGLLRWLVHRGHAVRSERGGVARFRLAPPTG